LFLPHPGSWRSNGVVSCQSCDVWILGHWEFPCNNPLFPLEFEW
jgi:hypothetical protein